MARKKFLSSEKILATALTIADQAGMEGIGLLTMRKLASVLGVEAMSLYNYIKNKEDLVSLMVDAVIGQYKVPSPSEDWQAGLAIRARSMYKTLQAHPWAALTIMPRINAGDNSFTFINTSLALLEAGGFSLPQADKVLVTIDSYTYGFVLQEITFPISPAEYSQAAQSYWNADLEARFPAMARATALVAQKEYDGISDFEYGLQVVIQGIQKWD